MGEVEVKRLSAGRPSKIYDGIELYGPPPQSQRRFRRDQNALLSRGFAVLLDPPKGEAGIVGCYQLVFLDLHRPREKVMNITISPRLNLRRATDRRNGFHFLGEADATYTVVSTDLGKAGGLMRDLLVRQNLTIVALKTTHWEGMMNDTKGCVEYLRSGSVCKNIIQRMLYLICIIMAMAFWRFVMMYSAGSEQPLFELMGVLVAEASEIWQTVSDVLIAIAGSSSCMFVTTVPIDGVQKCLQSSSAYGFETCIKTLIARALA